MSSGTCYQSTLHLPGSNHRLIKTVALISNPNHIKSVNRPTANQSAPAQCAAAMDEQKKGKKAGTETKGDDTGWKNVRVYGWTKVAHDDRTLPGNTPRAKKNVPTFGPKQENEIPTARLIRPWIEIKHVFHWPNGTNQKKFWNVEQYRIYIQEQDTITYTHKTKDKSGPRHKIRVQ